MYFVSFVVVAQFVMLNLFIMIIVEDFEAADRRDKNMTPHDVAVRTPCRSLRTVVAVSDEALVCTGVQDGVEAVRPYWPQVHQVVRSVATDAAAATSTRTWQWQQVPRLHSQARRHEAEEVRRLLLAACCGGVTHMLLARSQLGWLRSLHGTAGRTPPCELRLDGPHVRCRDACNAPRQAASTDFHDSCPRGEAPQLLTVVDDGCEGVHVATPGLWA